MNINSTNVSLELAKRLFAEAAQLPCRPSVHYSPLRHSPYHFHVMVHIIFHIIQLSQAPFDSHLMTDTWSSLDKKTKKRINMHKNGSTIHLICDFFKNISLF